MGCCMQTNAERLFNEDYSVLRHLEFTCKIKPSKQLMILWIRTKGEEAAKAAEIEAIKELNSVRFKKQLTRQSKFETEELKFLNEE